MKIERERSYNTRDHWLWSNIVAHSPKYKTSLESIGNSNSNNTNTNNNNNNNNNNSNIIIIIKQSFCYT